jgi:PilZ domain
MSDLSSSVGNQGAAPAPFRNRSDKRTGVLWPAVLEADSVKLPCIVLDISAAGAKLRSTDPLAGNLNKFRLNIDSLGAFDCAHVWERAGRVGLRFLGVPPTRAQIDDLIDDPPYLQA